MTQHIDRISIRFNLYGYWISKRNYLEPGSIHLTLYHGQVAILYSSQVWRSCVGRPIVVAMQRSCFLFFILCESSVMYFFFNIRLYDGFSWFGFMPFFHIILHLTAPFKIGRRKPIDVKPALLLKVGVHLITGFFFLLYMKTSYINQDAILRKWNYLIFHFFSAEAFQCWRINGNKVSGGKYSQKNIMRDPRRAMVNELHTYQQDHYWHGQWYEQHFLYDYGIF